MSTGAIVPFRVGIAAPFDGIAVLLGITLFVFVIHLIGLWATKCQHNFAMGKAARMGQATGVSRSIDDMPDTIQGKARFPSISLKVIVLAFLYCHVPETALTPPPPRVDGRDPSAAGAAVLAVVGAVTGKVRKAPG